MATRDIAIKQLTKEFLTNKEKLETIVFKEDFKRFLETVKLLVGKAKEELSTQADTARKENLDKIESELNKALAKVDTFESRYNSAMQSFKNEIQSDNRTTRRMLEQQIRDFADSIPGEYDDSPLHEQMEEILSKMPSEFDPSEIIMNINDHETRIDQLEKRPRGGGGGGTSSIGVAQAFKYIAHTEAPTGDIDGANTTYTVENNIWWIAGFSLNGEQIAELPNFTYSGKTITFSTALPATYSGKDFEVKYIGT